MDSNLSCQCYLNVLPHTRPLVNTTSGYSGRNMASHTCPRITRPLRCQMTFFAIPPLLEDELGTISTGRMVLGNRREISKTLQELLSSSIHPQAKMIHSFSELPYSLDGPLAGKRMTSIRVFQTSRSRTLYWSPRVRWGHSCATMMKLMAHIPLREDSGFNSWSTRVRSTAQAIECLADYVDPTFEYGSDVLETSDWINGGLEYFSYGYDVNGLAWNEMSMKCGEYLFHPTYMTDVSLLEEDAED